MSFESSNLIQTHIRRLADYHGLQVEIHPSSLGLESFEFQIVHPSGVRVRASFSPSVNKAVDTTMIEFDDMFNRVVEQINSQSGVRSIHDRIERALEPALVRGSKTFQTPEELKAKRRIAYRE